jgi:IS5 family transposase
MAGQRFKEVGLNTFFGGPVYERLVPREHFLVKLKAVIDWEAFTELLVPAYKGLASEGRPPYPPVVVLKMLIIAYLYGLSERQTEEVTNMNLAIKEFVGLAIDDVAPDHSTLSEFNRRLRELDGWHAFEEIGDRVLRQAQQAGVKLGSIQLVDSVHTVANVDHAADRQRQEEGRAPRDRQAQLVKKGQRAQTGPDGKITKRELLYLGYKSHVSMNAATGLITTLKPTGGSASDGRQFARLLEHDEELGVRADIYSGDKAYDDTDLHYRLWQLGKHSALRLNAYRTTAGSTVNQAYWQRVKDSPEYQAGLAERYKVERKFGEAKLWHRFGRCRYLGLLRYGIQAHLTALVLNLKRIVTMLTGVRFRAGTRNAKLRMGEAAVLAA